MRMFSTVAWTAVALAVAQPAVAAPFLPTFDPANFTGNTVPTNPYFPVVKGQVRTYVGQPADEKFILTGVGEGPRILGVKTSTVRDSAYEGGLLVEDTLDYYAQDRQGNVWYFGEDVTNYEYDDDGNLIGTNSSSSWRAGVHGAKPGYIMPTNRSPGFNYYQEFAPQDDALDQATNIAVLPSFTVPTGTYRNVLQVLETTELDKKSRGLKYYAPGVGLIHEEEGVRENLKNPRQTFSLTSIGTVSGAASGKTPGPFEYRVPPRR